MCVRHIECTCSTQSSFQFEIDIQQQHHQAVYWMDNSLATMGSLSSSNDENPRVKFLCSFSGSILPRPQDGKLRYVGGETRIVSVPRDITYEELMTKMRELYEGATVLKYQQPDEDLDALVSVVNDDDVINMMEEYDKLGSGDGFTRLRIFLFTHPDQDASSHFVDGDERDTERRYVDALNSLNDSPEFWKQEGNESVVAGGLDDIHAAEQYFSQISLEGGLHNQNIPQFNLRHLTIPHMGSGQLQQMEAPWSPAYYSPRHPGTHDPRASVEFPTSPSSARYRSSPYGEFSEKGLDRMSDEYSRQHVNHQSPLDNQPQFSDNVVWLSNGPTPGDKSGFPGNVLHSPNIFDGSSICEHCRMAFHRNQAYPDSPWKHGEHPHLEQPNVANGLHQVTSPSAECPPNRETFMLSTDAKYQHGFYPREPNDLRPLYNEAHNHERAWIMQPQSNPRVDEPRSHIPGAGRLNDPYIVDGTGMHIPILPGNLADGNHVTSNFVHEDMRYIRPGPELRNEVFHDHTLASGSHIHVPPLDERGARYGYPYGADNLHQASHGHAPAPAHGLWRHVHNPLQVATPYEVSASPPQTNGVVSPGFIKGSLESSPRFSNGVESHNPWVESSQKMVGVDASTPGVSYGHALKLNPQTYAQENQCLVNAESVPSTIDMLSMTNPRDPVQLSDSVSVLTSDRLASLTTLVSELRSDTHVTESVKMVEKCINQERKEADWVEKVGDSIVEDIAVPDRNKNLGVASSGSINSNGLRPVEECSGIVKANENGAHAPLEDKALCDHLSFLPEIISSIKKETLEGVGEVKTKATDVDSIIEQDVTSKEETRNEPESADVHGDVELDSDNDNPNNSKIEPTKAEEEAIKMGLQTIKNDDLEEIKELGSGTYGAVYHGKWKGSDVAIKRIKASCFAGRPLERERLIADFWKEALILSSLHHPNVVSFYGIVRDGPDGSLATVTEFMINGSLKQFLQKKDRTIDRRKRLIIAMDAAFGMEYLHGKNIVHFDLKCENLLVNMRDPHRPVCKIGDLGLSKVKQHTLVSGGVRGTLPWMAPELLSGKSNMVTEKIDVYSFGIVMWEVLTGDEPYADMHCASIIVAQRRSV
ncbi:uncharacterized protein LOC127794484 isoform X2 [Diospyros lotus]|uniref:uncharacterized protein LOC127794484 isoform X2 n=1 Tax=Diospyros lotus TaxID=55363 RepID=UPI00224EE6C7|nr:uncharacterized protein LOC127794484 isoform X2 [Diospyros lotus]